MYSIGGRHSMSACSRRRQHVMLLLILPCTKARYLHPCYMQLCQPVYGVCGAGHLCRAIVHNAVLPSPLQRFRVLRCIQAFGKHSCCIMSARSCLMMFTRGRSCKQANVVLLTATTVGMHCRHQVSEQLLLQACLMLTRWCSPPSLLQEL